MSTPYSLCPACDACPTVEFGADSVRIGEGEHTALLRPAEWNTLVELIQSGRLGRI
jgi:hypothetical protein